MESDEREAGLAYWQAALQDFASIDVEELNERTIKFYLRYLKENPDVRFIGDIDVIELEYEEE